MAIIIVIGITKKFKNFIAVNNLSFSVPENKILIHPNTLEKLKKDVGA